MNVADGIIYFTVITFVYMFGNEVNILYYQALRPHSLTDSLTHANVEALPGIMPPWNMYLN